MFFIHCVLLDSEACGWGTGCLIHVLVSWTWGMSFSPLTPQNVLHSNPLGVGNQTGDKLMRRLPAYPGVKEKFKDGIHNLKFQFYFPFIH